MQQLSYEYPHPVFEFGSYRFDVQLFTFENVYGLDERRCATTTTGSTFTLRCEGLTWAGGQATAEGEVALQATPHADGLRFEITAAARKVIRSVKLRLTGLPTGTVVSLREGPLPVNAEGIVLHYPSGWRSLATPLVVVQTGKGRYLYFRSLDERVRGKRMALLERAGRMDVELIYEPLATEPATRLEVPAWEVGECADPAAVYAAHADHVARSFGLEPWETRADVPAWAREVALVAAVHGQHFTGRIFNGYRQILDKVRWLADRLEPRRLLVYLPGWEGRYYWQYGEYAPDARMGGETGFAELAEGARALGVRLMPMFGINVVNQGLENFEQWGRPAVQTSASGIAGGPTVDWDSSRHYDHGWAALLNPGAPTWQGRLVDQVTRLLDRYGLDAVFLDISAGWQNDRRYDVYAGTRELIRRLRAGRPELLVAGEGWYDGMSALLPLHQAGHTDGRPHWHDEPYAPFFERCNRAFGHLCQGDPAHGSTGVHELGFNPVDRVPARRGILPTLTLVDDTLEAAPDQVEAIIESAKAYAEAYL